MDLFATFALPPTGPYRRNAASLQAIGLRAWWPMLGGNGQGLLRDFSPYGVTGAPQSGATWQGDPLLGGVLSLDNTTASYVDLSGAVLLTAGSPFTLSWWEYVQSGGGAFPARWRLPVAGSTTNGFIVLRNDNNASYQYLAWGTGTGGGTGLHATGVPSLASSVGVWHHWALVGADPVSTTLGDFVVYVDGVAYAPTATTAFSTGDNTTAHLGYDGLDNAANCLFADPRVYSRALSAAEVWQLWAPQTRWALYQPQVAPVVGALTVQLILPASDVTVNSWTTDTGATTALYQRINENPAVDSSYIQSGLGSFDEYRTRLAAFPVPTDTTNWTILVRNYKTPGTGSQTVNLRVRLYASNGTSIIHEEVISALGSSVLQTTISLTSGEAATVTQTDATAGLIVGLLPQAG